MVVSAHLNLFDRLGVSGVDLFFVISGFIMGTIGQVEPASVFIRKRVARVVPLYWLMTIAMCLGDSVGLLHSFTVDARTLIMSLLFIPYFDTEGHIWPLIVPGWTLNYEMFFYGVFALGLYTKRPMTTTIAVLIPLTILGVLWHPTSAIGRTWTSPMLLEFLGGLLVSSMRNRLSRAAIGALFVLTGIAALTLSGPLRLAIGGEYRVLTWGVPMLMITAGALAVEFGGHWPAKLTLPLQAIGDWSYSLYLVHGLVIAVGHRVLGTSLVSTVIIFAASIGVSRLVFLWFEKPSATFALCLLTKRAAKAPTAPLPDPA